MSSGKDQPQIDADRRRSSSIDNMKSLQSTEALKNNYMMNHNSKGNTANMYDSMGYGSGCR